MNIPVTKGTAWQAVLVVSDEFRRMCIPDPAVPVEDVIATVVTDAFIKTCVVPPPVITPGPVNLDEVSVVYSVADTTALEDWEVGSFDLYAVLDGCLGPQMIASGLISVNPSPLSC